MTDTNKIEVIQVPRDEILKVSEITVKSDRARRQFDPEKLIVLAESFKQVGIIQPLIVTREGERIVLVAGERRLRAAVIARMSSVPVIFRTVNAEGKIEGISSLEQKRIELHENYGRENFSWSEEAHLVTEIDTLEKAIRNTPGTLRSEAWTQNDTAKLIGVDATKVSRSRTIVEKFKERPKEMDSLKHLPLNVALDRIADIERKEKVQGMIDAGDIKPLSDFRLGDCLVLIKDIPSESIDCIPTDPPYGIPTIDDKKGIEWTSQTQSYRSGLAQSDNLDYSSVMKIMDVLVPEMWRVLKPGGHMWMFFGWEVYEDMLWLLRENGFDVPQFPVIWKKNGQTSAFKGYEPMPCYEQLLLCHKGKRSKRLRDPMKSIIEFDTVSKPNHPFEKPQKLLKYLINQSTDAGDMILDPFAGSASTLRAATLTGRSAIGFEINKDRWLIGQELLQKEIK